MLRLQWNKAGYRKTEGGEDAAKWESRKLILRNFGGVCLKAALKGSERGNLRASSVRYRSGNAE